LSAFPSESTALPSHDRASSTRFNAQHTQARSYGMISSHGNKAAAALSVS
jgi:hypothetical protein